MAAPRIVEHPILGRPIREGDWKGLSEGTVPLLRRLIAEGYDEAVAAHAGMLRAEMRVIYDIYTQWFADTKRYLRDQGQDDGAIERQHADIRARLAPYHAPLPATAPMCGQRSRWLSRPSPSRLRRRPGSMPWPRRMNNGAICTIARSINWPGSSASSPRPMASRPCAKCMKAG